MVLLIAVWLLQFVIQATIVFSRGKKRIGFDLAIKANWTGLFPDVLI